MVGRRCGARAGLRGKAHDAPGTAFRYSDINFIVLGEIVRRVSGAPLDEFAMQEIFRPLAMMHTRFVPPAEWHPQVAPTERLATGILLRGTVHDPTARRMGGVAGHAGLFTTAADLARFARMMLGRGELDGVRVFLPETVAEMTRLQTPAEEPARGLGWDIDSPYAGPRGDGSPSAATGTPAGPAARSGSIHFRKRLSSFSPTGIIRRKPATSSRCAARSARSPPRPCATSISARAGRARAGARSLRTGAGACA